MNHAIEVTNLEKCYGAHKVLKGLTFSVRQGEIFALLGANGAGKTTTLECLEGLRPYDSGCIVVSGKRGIQLQSASLPGYLQCREAVQLFAKWNHVPVDTAMLAALGIPDLAKKRYNTLSTGQKRRLHLALALLGHPDTIFLDEPTAGLDPKERIRFRNLISELAEDRLVILSTHIVSDVEYIAGEILLLKEGTLVQQGAVQDLLAAAPTRVWTCLVPREAAHHFLTHHLVANVKTLPQGTQLRILSPTPPIPEAVPAEMTLEDLFLHHFGEKGGDGLAEI